MEAPASIDECGDLRSSCLNAGGTLPPASRKAFDLPGRTPGRNGRRVPTFAPAVCCYTAPMNEEFEFDFVQRYLCPDGACTGLVGPDGRCSVCGLAGGPPPERGAAPAGARESRPAVEASGAAPEGADGGFDSARRLCDDGTCVGVIESDGRCGVCGRVSGS